MVWWPSFITILLVKFNHLIETTRIIFYLSAPNQFHLLLNIRHNQCLFQALVSADCKKRRTMNKSFLLINFQERQDRSIDLAVFVPIFRCDRSLNQLSFSNTQKSFTHSQVLSSNLNPIESNFTKKMKLFWTGGSLFRRNFKLCWIFAYVLIKEIW